MNGEKIVVLDGLRFVRDDRTCYYLANKKSARHRVRLHRYIWEKYNGPIPEGFHVHHKDHDKSNNTIGNLELLTEHEHRMRHAAEMTGELRKRLRDNIIAHAVPAAVAWHKTAEGRAWHSMHAKRDCDALYDRHDAKCAVCGRKFMATHSQRFCSNACKSKWRRMQGVDMIERTCPICGRVFRTCKYDPHITCGHSCANLMMWRKRKCA